MTTEPDGGGLCAELRALAKSQINLVSAANYDHAARLAEPYIAAHAATVRRVERAEGALRRILDVNRCDFEMDCNDMRAIAEEALKSLEKEGA